MSIRMLFVLSAIVAFSFAPIAQAQKSPPKKKPVAVVVIDVDGEMSIVNKKELKSHKKGLEAQHKDAIKNWNFAKKEAKKAKSKFTDPKPKKQKMKSLGNFKSEKSAREFMKKESAKRAKKKPKKDK